VVQRLLVVLVQRLLIRRARASLPVSAHRTTLRRLHTRTRSRRYLEDFTDVVKTRDWHLSGVRIPILFTQNVTNDRFILESSSVVVVVVVVVVLVVHRVSKTVQTYFLSELCKTSTDCGNFWRKDSNEREQAFL